MGAPAQALAGPPDDWVIEVKNNDNTLVQQRFAKLKRKPFDQKQWRALERAIGSRRLAKKIAAAHARAPNDIALSILDARASWASGDPSGAADRLAKIEGRAGKKYKSRIFELRVDALEAAKRYPDAVAALQAAAAAAKSDEIVRKRLRRAYLLADRGRMYDDALRIAQTLAAKEPKDVDAKLRVARVATAAGDHALADEAFVDAIAVAPSNRRADLTARRAQARLNGGSAGHAAELTWDLLKNSSSGRRGQREDWWRLLEQAHRRAATSEVLAGKLRTWLENKDHAKEPAAWKTLARAQGAAGLDPIPAWRRALQSDPRDSEVRAELIEALEASGDSAGALEEYRKLVAYSKHEARLGLDMAMRLITNGERATGLSVAREIEARAGKRAHTLLLLLEFYNDLEESQKALEIARQLIKVQPRNADARVAIGEQLFQMGQQKEAIEHWAMLPKLMRPSHAGWARYAEILSEHATGRNAVHRLRPKADEALKKALAAAPENPNYLRLRAVLYEEQHHGNLAYETWQKVREHSDTPETRLLREEARTRMVELLSNNRKLKNRTGERHKAIAEAQRELARGPSPEALEAGLFLAELYTREENYVEAVAKLLRVNEMYPGDAELLVQLAAAERRAGQISQAMDTLQQVMEIDPSRRADVLTELSELSFRVGDIDTALATATRAATGGGPDGRRALIRLGELHEKNGDLDRALEAYRTALENDPKDPRARVRIAELQLTKGDVEGSAATFREILEHGGPPDLMRQAGHRALDLAEATGQTDELLALAVRRTKRDPDGDEPREFLLDTLDRTRGEDVEHWLRASKRKAPRDDNRVSALRRPLVAALSRGSVGVRLRAAEHLGALRLPDTADVLARMGKQLTTPRDATAAVAAAFRNARAAAIRAAGELGDPQATPILVELLSSRTSGPERVSAAWGLARSDDEAATGALRRVMRSKRGDQVLALACIGVGREQPGLRAGTGSHHGAGDRRAQLGRPALRMCLRRGQPGHRRQRQATRRGARCQRPDARCHRGLAPRSDGPRAPRPGGGGGAPPALRGPPGTGPGRSRCGPRPPARRTCGGV